MPIEYKMSIQSTLEVFAFITILIGFANEDKIKAWEHRKWKSFKRWLHRRLNKSKRLTAWAAPAPKIRERKENNYEKI